MKKISFVIVFLLVLLGNQGFAQSASDTIQYKDRVYLFQNEPLTLKSYDSLLQVSDNKIALDFFEKGRKNSRIGLQ